jgi:hypothetical protein
MKIETKYNIGDEVWCIEQEEDWTKPYKTYERKCVVEAIHTSKYGNDKTHVIYSLSTEIERHWISKHETEVFKTKEELLKSL